MQAPSALTTFLFTDIEGSTRLWETDPVRMADALARHDRLCRTSVEASGGQVVKMIGDGLHAVFAEPAAAVTATLALQRGTAAIAQDCGIPFKMRCGVHAGPAQERDGDYFGSTVNRAARIMGAAHGEQVLLSQSVIDFGPERFPAGTGVRHVGRVRLRDLAAPVDVWQLLHPDLPATFPALRSLDATPNNLPQQLTSFIGREREIAEVKTLLARTRLLTLTGSGGCGKTRLALQLAADVLEAFPDGVWMAELAALADPALVPQTVAAILGLREEPGKNLTQSVTEFLKPRQVLLMLDNCEHVLVACARLANAVLRECPQVMVLVSSREALGIGGEHSYRVPSLAVPDPKRDTAPEQLSTFESVRLLVERAQSHAPQFALTHDNAQALASICYRLDGIPLALELAAARLRALSVQEVNQRLDERFRLLTGGSRSALPRQQTLRSLIDWSYDLLTAIEQALFCRVAVFAGGWTLEAAERVCIGDGIEESEVLDLVIALADKSLMVAEETNGATRYRLLETVRQYAQDQLLQSGNGSRWRDRHLEYFLAQVETAEPELAGTDQQAWLDRLEAEHDNLRSALAWSSSAGGDATSGLRLAGAFWRFWYVRGYIAEGSGWLSTLLADARNSRPVSARANALSGAGTLTRQQGDYSAARAMFEESLAIWRQLGERQGIAAALNNLGVVASQQGDYRAARGLHEESLAIRRTLGDRWGTAATLGNLGNVAYFVGDHATARTLHGESLAIERELGNRYGIAASLESLGLAVHEQGDYPEARAMFEESLSIRRELGHRWGIANSLHNLGNVAYAQGDHPGARALYEDALAMQRELGDRQCIASALDNLGHLAADRGDSQAVRALHEESLAIRWALGDRRGVASSLEGLAPVASASIGPEHAARIWGQAERLREEIGSPLPANEWPRYDRELSAARATLGDDAAFALAWKEGRAMTLEAAVEYALSSRIGDTAVAAKLARAATP